MKQFEATQRAVTDRGTLFELNTLVSFIAGEKTTMVLKTVLTQESSVQWSTGYEPTILI